MEIKKSGIFFLATIILLGCSKKSDTTSTIVTPTHENVFIQTWWINGVANQTAYNNASMSPVIKFLFSTKVDRSTVASAFSLTNNSGVTVACNFSYQNSDSVLIVTPAANLLALTKYSKSQEKFCYGIRS